MAAGDVKTDSCDRQPPIPRCTRHASRLWETSHPLRSISWSMGARHNWEPHPWGECGRSRMHRVCTVLSPTGTAQGRGCSWGWSEGFPGLGKGKRTPQGLASI